MQPSRQQALRLCDFLQQRQEDILARWERALRRSDAAGSVPESALRDHVPELLRRIGDVVRTVQPARASLDDLPDLHALDRLATGFDLRAAADELALLRDVALELWQPHAVGHDAAAAVEEIRRFNRAVDEVIARSVDRYARARARTLMALDRVSSAALDNDDVAQFLPRLLEVILETTATADSAYLLLRDEGSDTFRVRAAAGADAELSRGFAVRVGQGFAGEIARRREPMLVHDASTDPLVLNPALRRENVHALFGVPLVHRGEVVGVAKLASRSAYDFSADDKHLFVTMAQRATALIVQAHLIARERDAVAAERRSEGELGHLMHVSPDMLAIVGADGHLKRINPAFSTVMGYSEAELLARPYGDFVHPYDRERVAAEARAVLAGSPSRRFVFRVVRNDGAVRRVSFNASGEANADAFVAVGRDVTEERERSEFEQQLIGIVSHDLRGPLHAILLSSAALAHRSAAMDPKALAAVRRIHSAAEQAAALTRDLLDFTRARVAGGIGVTPRPLDLHALARGVAEDVHTLFPRRELRLEPRGDGRGRWDPARLAQVVENLVSNAFKYGAPDAPVVVRTAGDDGGWVRLEVHNEGAPIPPALLPHVFEPLRQGKRAGAVGGAAGIGLGLYIVDHLVRAHGGTIDVRSTAEEGTTFGVTLPRAPAERG